MSYYYELDSSPGISPKVFKGKFDFLDNVDITEKLLEFNEQDTQIVSFVIPAIHCSSCIWVLENLNKLNDSIKNTQVNFPEKSIRITYNSSTITLKKVVKLLCMLGYEPSISLEDFNKKEKKTDRALIYKLGGVYCIRNGVSKLSKINDNGKDQIVKIASKGELMGQRSVISEETTNLSSVALNDMEVCFIPKSEITDRIQDNPAFTQAILKHMAQELKMADDFIVNMAQKTVNQRLAEVLLYLSTTFGADDEGYLALILSRADIADVVGTATELCIRTLAKFKKQGLIETKGKRIKVLDESGLKQLKDGF